MLKQIGGRREVLRLMATTAVAVPAGTIMSGWLGVRRAFAGPGLLAKLQAQKSVRIGIANQPPYSALEPDGSVTGIAPTLVKMVMAKLGITQIEGIVAPYGQLIPGMQADRWDMIGAALTITKERCSQVLYADPMAFDGGAIAYIPAEVKDPPKSIADAAKSGATIGILAGSYLLKKAQSLGVPASNIAQFPDNPALIDGLAAKRMQLALSTYSALRDLRKARNNLYDLAYPLSDDQPHGAAPAFRREDTYLYDAFQRELRALKKSGDYTKVSEQYGFEVEPSMVETTAEQACSTAT